jgi:hypothetical protein
MEIVTMIGFSRDTNPVGRVWAYVEGSLDNTTGLLTGFVRSHTNSLTEGAHIRGVLIFYNAAEQNIYVAELPSCGVGGQIEEHYTESNPRYCRFQDSIPTEIATQITSIGVETFAGAGSNEWLAAAVKVLVTVAAAAG